MSSPTRASVPWWGQALRGFFAVLMLATAVGKLLDMPGFYAVLRTYQALPEVLIVPSAWAITALELVLAAWLVVGRWLKLAALAVVATHTMYLAWITTAWLRGLQLDNCGCFGVFLARPLTAQTIVEDLVLLLAAVALLLAARHQPWLRA